MLYSTFKEAVISRGLLYGDNENYELLHEASSYEMPHELRNTFASMLLFCNPMNPLYLFEKFIVKLTEDYLRLNPSINATTVRGMAAYDINCILEKHGCELEQFILGEAKIASNQSEQENVDPLLIDNILNSMTFNNEQMNIYKRFDDAVQNYNDENWEKLFMIQARAGAGKTYLLPI